MRDPRIGYMFAKTWDSETDYCAKAAMERHDEIDRLRGELAAIQSENAEKDREIERLRAKAKQWRQTAEENFASCEKLQAALTRVEAERDAARQDCAVAEENHCNAVACICEVEEAIKFQRPSAVMVAISKWRGAQGEG